jgi:predicted dithiol-disulfide oxidoreductase (DUF899 family)
MGWSFPWASSFGSDFNIDFGVSFTGEQQREGIEFNYHRELVRQLRGGAEPEIPYSREAAAMTGSALATYTLERMGVICFALEDGGTLVNFHWHAIRGGMAINGAS